MCKEGIQLIQCVMAYGERSLFCLELSLNNINNL